MGWWYGPWRKPNTTRTCCWTSVSSVSVGSSPWGWYSLYSFGLCVYLRVLHLIGPSIPVCHSMTDPSLCNHTHGCTYNASLSSCVTKFDNDIALARIAEQIQGLWFSTPAQGQCNGAHSSEYNSSVLPCTWLELQRQNINASCVNDLVIDGIWKYTKPYGLQCRIDNCGVRLSDIKPKSDFHFLPCFRPVVLRINRYHAIKNA
eukprot:m.41851 g.41851  ORF g.41851 m.41851 type:complete len:203 (-) comp9818_c0_seq3:160-768(-)